MSRGVLSYVDAKSVECNEAGEPFSSAWRCIKFDSQGSKLATPTTFFQSQLRVRAQDSPVITRILLETCEPVHLAPCLPSSAVNGHPFRVQSFGFRVNPRLGTLNP